MGEQSNEAVITPEAFSSSVFTTAKQDGVTILEAMVDTCVEMDIHPDDAPQYLTPQLRAHLEGECKNNNLLKEKQTTNRIF